jgi:hypothetical protein
MCQTDGQRVDPAAQLCRQGLGIAGESALAIQLFAGRQRAFRHRHRIAAPGPGAAGGLAPQRRVQDRDRQLHPDQVKRLVHRRIAPGGIGGQAVLPETGGGIVGFGLQHDVDAPAQVAEHRPPVAFEGGDDLDHAVAVQLPAKGCGAQHMGQVIDAAGREFQPVFRHLQVAGIGDGAHLDGRLGAVEEGVEHLRVHPRRLRLIGRQAVVRPDVVGGDMVIGGQVFGALARRRDGEAGGARPVHHFRHQRRLVAVGH